MRKVDNGEKKQRKKTKKEKIMHFIVATNVVASWLPEHRPTGMPTAPANSFSKKFGPKTFDKIVFIFKEIL